MLQPVILAGGTGSRLWPLSRELYPKQFIALTDSNTMFINTIHRVHNIPIEQQPPVIVCNDEHRFIAAEQLRTNNNKHNGIILEPASKNTAPAIALAALWSIKDQSDPVLMIFPSDHLIQNNTALNTAIKQALPYALDNKLVTFGIKPHKPETGYGYIKYNNFTIEQFIEKPDSDTAEMLYKQSCYLWNSGIFMFKASKYLSELQKYNPEIYNICKESIDSNVKDLDFIKVNSELFNTCPKDSIDYAVMQKTTDGVVIPLDSDVGWSDLGSWNALWEAKEKDSNNNVLEARTINIGTKNCYIKSTSKKIISTINLDNLAIINTNDALLVADKTNIQEVKQIVNEMNLKGLPESKIHDFVHRPWGKYICLDDNVNAEDKKITNNYKVKRISINPGEKLSLQKHMHRAEHWVIVTGTAKVTKGDKTFYAKANESIYIPAQTIHCIQNDSTDLLQIIEIQTGSYLEENDIIRFDDKYGRVNQKQSTKEVN